MPGQESIRSGPQLGRRVWTLATARSISFFGNGFGRVALVFGVLRLPHAGPTQVSVVLACQTVAQVLVLLGGGVVADRVSRSRLMVVAEAVSALAWAGLAIEIDTRTSMLWLVCLLAAAAGASMSLFTPANAGVVPELVAQLQLRRANAVIRTGQNVALFAGLGFAGLAVAAFGPAGALGVNAVSFALSAFLIAQLRVPRPPAPRRSHVQDLREGARVFFGRQWLWGIVAQYGIVVAAMQAIVGVLGPLESVQRFNGARSWATIVAAQALGTIVGAGVASRVRFRYPTRTVVLLTFVLAVPGFTIGGGAPLWWCVAAMFVAGFAGDVVVVTWQTTVQQEVPREFLSRVSSYDFLGSLCLAPLGLIVAGPLSTAIGLRNTLFACSTLVIVVSAIALTSRDIRDLQPVDTGASMTRPAVATVPEVTPEPAGLP